MPKIKFCFAVLLAMAAVPQHLEAADPAFMTVDVIKNSSAFSDSGNLSVKFFDETGRQITEAVNRQGYFHWSLKRQGAAVDPLSPPAAGGYDFVLNYGGRFLHRSVEIRSNHITVINVRPGSVHLTLGPFGDEPKKIQLIFTRVPVLTADEFARNGCRDITPNIALIVNIRGDSTPGTLYLPPGLYRIITQYDRRLKSGDSFLKVERARPLAIKLGDHGLRADPAAAPPVYAGKCYY